MKKTAVIFDMDGLMFDTQCIYNKSYDEIAMSLYGFKVPPDMKFIRQSFDRVAELVKTKLPARPGLDVILPYLKEKGYRLGIASGSERRVVDNNLQSSGLGHYFAASLCGDEVVHSKPDPESYLRVAEMIGKKPEECFVLEDSPNGILAAYRAGCAPIMIPNDVQPDRATRDLCAGIFHSLSEVVDALESGQLS